MRRYIDVQRIEAHLAGLAKERDAVLEDEGELELVQLR